MSSVTRVNASKFKEQCLALLDNLGPEGIVVTKHGKPVARIIPASTDCAALIGSMKGRIRVKGDILSAGLKWNAES
jgi:prevent-host-death family protein